jgi:hypothetical protein
LDIRSKIIFDLAGNESDLTIPQDERRNGHKRSRTPVGTMVRIGRDDVNDNR